MKPNFKKTYVPVKLGRATPQPTIQHDQLLTCCGALARDNDILSKFAASVQRTGLIGEARNAQVLFLCIISCLLPRPVSAVVKGARSSGKNTLVESVLKFFPKEAHYQLTAMSEKALAYFSEPLKNRALVITEAAGLKEGGDYFLRSLLSEGNISYEVTVGGKTKKIEIEGPTGLILTTTKVKLYEDDESRLISLEITESRSHTHEVLKGIGRSFADPRKARKKVIPAEWLALVKWVAAKPTTVVIPFAEAVARLMSTNDARLHRDANALFGLVSAHALLHRRNRTTDKYGNLIAVLDDYKIVRGLVHDLIARGVESAVSPSVRAVVQAVKKLNENGTGVSGRQICEALDLNKAGVSRHVSTAIEMGFIRNLEEGRRTARYIVGEALPTDMDVIPTVDAVARLTQALNTKRLQKKRAGLPGSKTT